MQLVVTVAEMSADARFRAPCCTGRLPRHAAIDAAHFWLPQTQEELRSRHSTSAVRQQR